jgi:hypothetical protein
MAADSGRILLRDGGEKPRQMANHGHCGRGLPLRLTSGQEEPSHRGPLPIRDGWWFVNAGLPSWATLAGLSQRRSWSQPTELEMGMPEELDEQELERLRMVRLTAPQ